MLMGMRALTAYSTLAQPQSWLLPNPHWLMCRARKLPTANTARGVRALIEVRPTPKGLGVDIDQQAW